MPGLDSKPTSEQLSKVVDLLFGMGVNDEDGKSLFCFFEYQIQNNGRVVTLILTPLYYRI